MRPGPYLDFQCALPWPDAAGRLELLAEVSAITNAGGSDLVYGADEDGEGRAADQHVSTAAHPFLNLVWHAFSMGRSFSYNAVGEWMGQ